MKRIVIYLTISFAFLIVCKAQTIEQKIICGKYYKLVKGKDFNTSYTLELNTDSTFKLIINTAAGNPQCTGKWKFMDNEFVMLKCNEDTNPYEMLSSGYMSEKEHKLQVIGKNKIKYKDVILKRKK